MFLITKFLATEALGKNTLADKRNSVGSCPLFVSTFTNVLVLHFKVKFDQLLILCREFVEKVGTRAEKRNLTIK